MEMFALGLGLAVSIAMLAGFFWASAYGGFISRCKRAELSTLFHLAAIEGPAGWRWEACMNAIRKKSLAALPQ